MLGKMKNLILVEDFDRDSCVFDFGGGGGRSGNKIIALTPMAMEKLNQYGYEYSIPGDYYVWHETPIYTRQFQEWLDQLNECLIRIYPELIDLDPPITVHCVAMLKNVMDAFTRRGKQFQAIMNKENPEVVCYLGGCSDETIDEELYFKGKSLFMRFADPLGEGVVYFINGDCNLPKCVTNWRDNRGIRTIYDYFRYCGFLPSWGRGKRYLFASAMDGVLTFREKGRICEVAIDYDVAFQVGNYPINYSIVKGVASFTGIDISIVEKVLESRLYYFINTIVPKILKYKLAYQRYLFRKETDCVIFTRRNKLYQYGLLLAASGMGIPTVYVKHGWEAYDNWSNDWRRLRVYDYFVTHNELDRVFFSKRVEENGWKCEVV